MKPPTGKHARKPPAEATRLTGSKASEISSPGRLDAGGGGSEAGVGKCQSHKQKPLNIRARSRGRPVEARTEEAAYGRFMGWDCTHAHTHDRPRVHPLPGVSRHCRAYPERKLGALA